jgi:HAD superfamily hydrolase (TIGR01509 family)
MIKLICFDLDGVLAETSWIHAGAFKEAVKSVAGYELSAEDEIVLDTRSTKRKLEMMKDSGLLTEEQVLLVNEKKQEETVRLVRQFVLPDIQKISMLRVLKERGIKLAVVSNCRRSTIDLILVQMRCLEYFDYIVSNQDVENQKPDPEGYIKAMQHFYMADNETLIVEDSDVGWQAAQASGALSLRVLNSTQVTLKNLEKVLCKF